MIVYCHAEIWFYLPLTKLVDCTIESRIAYVLDVAYSVTDTKEERNALMERIYPKLTDFCRDNYGLEFQVCNV